MLMMRLQRVGRRNDPSYRIVVTNKRSGPKSNKHVDRIGSYNPKQKTFQLDVDKAKEWLAKGVQPSDTMYNLLVSKGVIEGRKRNVLPKKSPVINEEAVKAEEEAKAAAEAKASEETAEASDTPVEEEAPVEAEAPTEEQSPEEKPTEEAPAEAEEVSKEEEKKAE